MSLQYSLIYNLNSPHFNDAMQIYRDSFPDNERHPIDTIKQRLQSGKQELYIGIDNENVVCIALLWYFDELNFILLDYFAVTKECRGKRIGSEFFRYLSGIATSKGKHLIMEVESPAGELNSAGKVKRINFYLNNGAYILKDIPYTLPSLNGTVPTEMILMVVPLNAKTTFSKKQVSNLITHLYIELYSKTENDTTLINLLHILPNQVELSKSL
ncbi:hypothetical protein CYCD_21720 [Tenuifilaceae bacterium CYCD]|nr:hypothetical protein CYCD_21720 [Tenuifilaceae bacterium CYCD]